MNTIDDFDAEIAAAMAATPESMRACADRVYAKGERVQVERAVKKANQRRLDRKLTRIQEARAETAKLSARAVAAIREEITDLESEAHALMLADRPDKADTLLRLVRAKRRVIDAVEQNAKKRDQQAKQAKAAATALAKQREAALVVESVAELTEEIAKLEALPNPNPIQKQALISKRAMLVRREGKIGLTVPVARTLRMTRARRIESVLQEIGAMRDAGAPTVDITHKMRLIADIRDGRLSYAEQKAAEQRLAREAKARQKALDAREKAYRKRQRAKSEAYRQATTNHK